MNAIGLGQWSRRLRVEDLFEEFIDLDRRATEQLDKISGGGIVGEGIEPSDSEAEIPLFLLTADVHRARRYYQRPEEQKPYREKPVEGATGDPLSRPTPDFHERASMLGDLSPLLRQLGLVVDLRVDEPELLADVVAIQGVVLVPGLEDTVAAQPFTACETTGRAFFAVSATGDYEGPLLRLGDEDLFRVLDLDPDASALKMEQYVRSVPRMLATETNGDRISSAPHALRATGFAFARTDRAAALQARLVSAGAKDAAIVNGTAPPLNLEDVTRGLRLEVWDDVSNR